MLADNKKTSSTSTLQDRKAVGATKDKRSHLLAMHRFCVPSKSTRNCTCTVRSDPLPSPLPRFGTLSDMRCANLSLLNMCSQELKQIYCSDKNLSIQIIAMASHIHVESFYSNYYHADLN